MKILTLNTWQERGPWQARWEVILQVIRILKPDVIAFQELFNQFWALEIKKRIGLPTMLFPEEHAGLVLYSRYPVSLWQVMKLSPSPLEDYGRYVLWAELKMQGKEFFVFNTHLSWKLEDGASRMRQLQEILHLAREKVPDQESILVGDLNAPPHAPEIQWFVREGKYQDLFSKFHPGRPGCTWDNRNYYAANSHHKMPDRRIDQILIRSGGSSSLLKKPSSCDLVYNTPHPSGIWASDHFGVLADFK